MYLDVDRFISPQASPPPDAMGYPYITKIAEGVPAAGEDSVERGPVYTNVLSKDGFHELPGISTLYEMFQ